MMNIKKLFTEYKEAENRANAADEAWEQDPENESLEKAFDETYKAESEAREALVKEIQKLIGIDTLTANKMIRCKTKELEALIERIA